MNLVMPKQNSDLTIFKNAIISLWKRGANNPASREDVLDFDPTFNGDEAGGIKRQTELGRYFDFIQQSSNRPYTYSLTPRGFTLAQAILRDDIIGQQDCFMTSIIHHTFGFKNNAHTRVLRSPIHPPRVILKHLLQNNGTDEDILNLLVKAHWDHPQVAQYRQHDNPPSPHQNRTWDEYHPFFVRKISDNKCLMLLTEIGILENNNGVYSLPNRIRTKYGNIIDDMTDIESNTWNAHNAINPSPAPFIDNDFRKGPVISDDGYVYIIAHPSWPNWYKVGKTVNLDQRLATYNTGAPHSGLRYQYAYTRHHSQARILELDFHNQYSYLRPQDASAEWYEVGGGTLATFDELQTLLDDFIDDY